MNYSLMSSYIITRWYIMPTQLSCSHSVNCLQHNYFNNNNESVNDSTSSVASKLTDAIKQSTFFTSASMESESVKVHLYVNNDIPSVITEAVLSCLYSNKRTVSGVVDGVKLTAVCSEFSIKT
ncbi:uncharacterized protein [Dysidea avara]|uniref:uncharacterized protein isoform X1 n=1 Tax=Dysidea avara TaxID=196820 RepID=UPI003330C92B